MRPRNRNRGITYVEIVVATAFVGICAATLCDSLKFSIETISANQRRTIVQNVLQSGIDEVRATSLAALPANGTTTTTVTLPGSRIATITRINTKVAGKTNLTRVQISASWPESRGTRSFTDTMSFETYMRGPDL